MKGVHACWTLEYLRYVLSLVCPKPPRPDASGHDLSMPQAGGPVVASDDFHVPPQVNLMDRWANDMLLIRVTSQVALPGEHGCLPRCPS